MQKEVVECGDAHCSRLNDTTNGPYCLGDHAGCEKKMAVVILGQDMANRGSYCSHERSSGVHGDCLG